MVSGRGTNGPIWVISLEHMANGDGESAEKAWITSWWNKIPSGWAIGIGLVVIIIGFVLALVFTWLCWFRWIPGITDWAFDPIVWWQVILALFAYMLLGVLPVSAFTLWGQFANFLLNETLGGDESQMRARLSEAEERQVMLEGEIRKFVDEERRGEKELRGAGAGEATVLPLLISRWSGAQLEAYYKTGMDQARRSFRYSVLAMWLGFFVLVAGVTIQLLDPLARWGLEATSTDVNFMVIAAGVIIEFIAGLFLWVHRTALQNLNTLYNAQMYRHSVILSNRIAEGIENTDTRDAVRRMVIERLLRVPDALNPEAPNTKSGLVAGLTGGQSVS